MIKKKCFIKEGNVLLIIPLLLIFLLPLTSADSFGYNYLTDTLGLSRQVNLTTTNVNNSQYFRGYEPDNFWLTSDTVDNAENSLYCGLADDSLNARQLSNDSGDIYFKVINDGGLLYWVANERIDATSFGTEGYYFMGDEDQSEINWDGTNLRINPNNTGSGIVYITGNLSVAHLIERSWYWDSNELGNALDYSRDTEEIKDATGKFDDNNLHDFEKATYLVTDYDRPVLDKGKVTYPYQKLETGKSISAIIGEHSQQIYELKVLVEDLQKQIQELKK